MASRLFAATHKRGCGARGPLITVQIAGYDERSWCGKETSVFDGRDHDRGAGRDQLRALAYQRETSAPEIRPKTRAF